MIFWSLCSRVSSVLYQVITRYLKSNSNILSIFKCKFYDVFCSLTEYWYLEISTQHRHQTSTIERLKHFQRLLLTIVIFNTQKSQNCYWNCANDSQLIQEITYKIVCKYSCTGYVYIYIYACICTYICMYARVDENSLLSLYVSDQTVTEDIFLQQH